MDTDNQQNEMASGTRKEEGEGVGSGAKGRTYTVKSGDTLSKIAKEFYGDANKYMDIFNANKDQLSDPNKIKPGQELNIP